MPLVRQAKLGASCRVRVPAEKGLTIHSYRVLQRQLRRWKHRTSPLKRTQGNMQAAGETVLSKA
jgi:hypothetical protein